MARYVQDELSIGADAILPSGKLFYADALFYGKSVFEALAYMELTLEQITWIAILKMQQSVLAVPVPKKFLLVWPKEFSNISDAALSLLLLLFLCLTWIVLLVILAVNGETIKKSLPHAQSGGEG